MHTYNLFLQRTRDAAMPQEKPIPTVEIDFERLQCYARGAQLVFANAEALYNEAQTLGKAGAFARATVLHQISMEECAKIDTLGAVVTSILMGQDVDETRLSKAFRDHKAKNYANAYNATPTREEHAARSRADWKASGEAFKKFQLEFHIEVNAIKNAGMYVDFQDGKFSAPKDMLGEDMAVAFMHLNADFLRRSEDFVRLLHRMESQPCLYTDLAKQFNERAEALRAAGETDVERVIEKLMKDMYEFYATKVLCGR